MKNNNAASPLFSQFDPVTKEQWKEKIIKDLKDGNYEKLIWKTDDGLNIEPFYTAEDLADLSYLDNFENLPEVRIWENREKIKVDAEDQANRLASEALHGGASGVAFEITKPLKCNLEKLFEKIELPATPVSFALKESAGQFLTNYWQFLYSKNIPVKELKGSLEFDPVAVYSQTGRADEAMWRELTEAVKLTEEAPSFRAVTINGGHFKDSGGSIAQEIAFTLNSLTLTIEKLKEHGVSPESVFKNLQLAVSIGVDYFMEIAKLKTLRILTTQLARAYGLIDYKPDDVKIHGYGSLWSKTIFDPSVNLLRDTTEAMSAIIGGCDSLTLEPYDADYKKPQAFLRRIARNVSTILKEEAYLDKVADPVAGSYYLKNLIDGLLRKSWELFQEIEAMGGYDKAFEQKVIQNKIREVLKAKRKKIAVRQEVIVGVNQYPDPKEKIEPDDLPEVEQPNKDTLNPQRASDEFEELRLATEKFVKRHGPDKRPEVFLAEYGENLVMKKARAAFSRGFFGTAGFEIKAGSSYEKIDEAVDDAKKQSANIVVLCGSDDDYAAMGEAFAQKFKSSVPDKLLVLAGYPATMVDRLKAAGFDDFIHIKSNAIETLRSMQRKLNIN